MREARGAPPRGDQVVLFYLPDDLFADALRTAVAFVYPHSSAPFRGRLYANFGEVHEASQTE